MSKKDLSKDSDDLYQEADFSLLRSVNLPNAYIICYEISFECIFNEYQFNSSKLLEKLKYVKLLYTRITQLLLGI